MRPVEKASLCYACTCTSSEKHGKVPLYWLSSLSRFACAMSSKCTTTVLPNLQHPTAAFP